MLHTAARRVVGLVVKDARSATCCVRKEVARPNVGLCGPHFTTYLTGAQDGQPWPIHHWIGFWVNTVGVDPTFFAYATAVGETAIAIALIVGAFTNLTAVVGVLLSVVIWTTAEGFGGPYTAGSTDIGAAIIYPLVFAGLFLSSAGLYYGVDRKLTPALGRFGYLASGWFVRRSSTVAVVKPLATQ